LNFTDLEVWKKARAFRKRIFHLTRSFPKEEKYALTDQLLRASRSVTANIAEGHGRFHYQENIRFCRIARGSLFEVLDHLICAVDCQLITEKQLLELKEEIEQINRILNGYIGYLKKQKQR
jgi:four helix bundle protein